MNIKEKKYYENLNRLFEASQQVSLKKEDKWVIFSDLHMGDKSSTDDFKRNSELFHSAAEYYLARGSKMILNGDVEELQRFSLQAIQNAWPETYQIFDEFNKDNRLYKTAGNHDLLLGTIEDYSYQMIDSLRLKYKENDLFVLHGHQASNKYHKSNDLVGLSLKYLADPLGIKNFSVAHNSRKKYKIEKRIYHYAKYKKIISIIGHTHRPLFESYNKPQRLRHKIEQLCRHLAAETNEEQQKEFLESIKNYKKELEKIQKFSSENPFSDSLYDSLFHIPSVFNSGTTIGKRGITCLEIENGEMALIHWFDKNISRKYLRNTGYHPEKLNGTPYHQMVINSESLDYIFTRIKVLS